VNPASGLRRSWLGVGIAILACAACCVGPLVALLGGVGIAAALGAWFVPVLIVLAIAALSAAGAVWWVRRRRRAACPAPTPLADLGIPSVSAARRVPR